MVRVTQNWKHKDSQAVSLSPSLSLSVSLSLSLPLSSHLEAGGEGDDPDRGPDGDPEQSVSDGSVRVVPGPPEELDPRDVVRSVDHLPHQTGQTDRGPEVEAQPPAGHCAAVHEDHVDTGDVQRHPGGQHDAGLGLPEVVHDGQHHEEGVVGRAGTERGHPDKEVGPAVTDGVDQGDERQEEEVKLSHHEGRHHHEPLRGVRPVSPRHTGPVWVFIKHFGSR